MYLLKKKFSFLWRHKQTCFDSHFNKTSRSGAQTLRAAKWSILITLVTDQHFSRHYNIIAVVFFVFVNAVIWGKGFRGIYVLEPCVRTETTARWKWRRLFLTPSPSELLELSASPPWASAWRPASDWPPSRHFLSVSPCPTPSFVGSWSRSHRLQLSY